MQSPTKIVHLGFGLLLRNLNGPQEPVLVNETVLMVRETLKPLNFKTLIPKTLNPKTLNP